MLYLRIEHNRDQREAVHALWEMGVLTADRPGDGFGAPSFATDSIWHHQEGWFANLQGTHEPWAAHFRKQYYPCGLEGIAALVRRVPSIRNMFVDPGVFGEEELEKLRSLLPNVEIHVVERPPDGATVEGREASQ